MNEDGEEEPKKRGLGGGKRRNGTQIIQYGRDKKTTTLKSTMRNGTICDIYRWYTTMSTAHLNNREGGGIIIARREVKRETTQEILKTTQANGTITKQNTRQRGTLPHS